ncbi:MAG: flagellar assembly protein FliH, partial [Actinomycetota bacterium]|nr:flagellar assembly protein FliH [Actinomycetota bacterium]
AGMADGRAAAAEQAAAVLSATRARLERLLQSTEAELAASEAHHRASLDQLADRAAELAFAIAEAVVGRELAIAVEPGRDAVARALAAADPGDTEVVVRLNPIDAQGLGTDDLAAGRPIIVVADDAVAPGDCLARVGATTIDARIGAALDRVRAVLVGGTT